jgi:hypothetical protein
MAGRISFTKLQRESGAAVALIELLSNITADGRIDSTELDLLREWLGENRDLGWKQFAFLEATIEKGLADGILTAEEEVEIYLSVEAVLPPADRALVTQRRKVAEAARKETRKRELWEAAEKKRVEAAEDQLRKNQLLPIFSLNFCVAGTRHDGRPEIIAAHAREYDRAYLRREPDNPKSPHAVAVITPNGMHIGYVPDWLAQQIVDFLAQGYPQKVHLGQIYEGTRGGPVVKVGGAIYRPGAPVTGAVTESETPQYIPSWKLSHRSGRSVDAKAPSFGSVEPQSAGGCLVTLAFGSLCLLFVAGLFFWR